MNIIESWKIQFMKKIELARLLHQTLQFEHYGDKTINSPTDKGC